MYFVVVNFAFPFKAKFSTHVSDNDVRSSVACNIVFVGEVWGLDGKLPRQFGMICDKPGAKFSTPPNAFLFGENGWHPIAWVWGRAGFATGLETNISEYFRIFLNQSHGCYFGTFQIFPYIS